MKNKNENLYLFLTFLPLALLTISVPMAILLAVGLLFYGQNYQNSATFKKSLHPLTLALVFAMLFGALQILSQIFVLFGQAIPTLGMARFVFVILAIFKVINIILLIALIIGIVFAIKAVVSNKKMPIFHKIIKAFETETSINADDNNENEEEIIIDEEE